MPKKKRSYRLYRRLRRPFRRHKQRVPLLPVIGGVVAPMAVALTKSNFMNDIQTDPMKATTGLIDQICQRYTGFAPLYPSLSGGQKLPFQTDAVLETYGGLALGIIGHKLAGAAGVNRAMHKIPFVGKYIEL